jgi:dephospho-CoA kinase
MPGSGKTEAVRVLREKGFAVVNMGDVVREETRRRGFPETPENVGRVSILLREEGGDLEIARRCAKAVERELARGRRVVIEGIRSYAEYEFFKRAHKDLVVIAIHSSPKTRFDRLVARGRGDDPKDWKTFEERDLRELGYGMGYVIALADHMIVNEGSIQDLRREVERVVRSF